MGINRPYPVKWDTTPYPPKFKALTLHTFDVKGSANQHICYFKFQTRNIESNDAILAHFIGILKGVAFEWFMKLPASSIKNGPASRSYFYLVSLRMIQKFQFRLFSQPSRREESPSKLSSRDFRAWHSVVLTACPVHWSRCAITICKLSYSLKWE